MTTKRKTSKVTKKTPLASFSEKELLKELERREKHGIKAEIFKKEKATLKALRREVDILSKGITYPISISGVTFDVVIHWEEDYIPSAYYTGRSRISRTTAQAKLIEVAVGNAIEDDPYQLEYIPSYNKAFNKIQNRITAIKKKSDKLAKKYKIGVDDFFNTYVMGT